MGLSQYDSLGEYCGPHAASSVFLILLFFCFVGLGPSSTVLIVVPLICILLGVILASAAFCAYTKYRKSQGNGHFTVLLETFKLS